jgi:Mrp family chromosome partitioning ATPase/capsular polysaccharide biosynthesis protein
MVDSQVEIIKSEAIALKVIEKLDLSAVSNTAGGDRSSWNTAIRNLSTKIQDFLRVSLVGSRDTKGRSSLAALPDFLGRISVKRIGLSSVIEVAFSSSDPEQSARVVNEVTEAYFADQAASAAAATASASAWLRERIKDLGTRTRIVSLATPPVRKDPPGRLILAGAFACFGLLLGIGFIVVRTALDLTLRDPFKAEAKLGAPFLGAVSKFALTKFALGSKKTQPRAGYLGYQNKFNQSDIVALARRIKVAAEVRGCGHIVGVTSTTAGEGATSIAARLAFSLASTGADVLLVDGNPYQSHLSSHLAPGALSGLADVLARTASSKEACVKICEAGPYFLSIGSGALRYHGCVYADARDIAQEWSSSYELIIVDLPPLTPTPDLGPARNVVDNFVLVVEWGKSTSVLIESALSAAELNETDLLGFVLNKVKRSAVSRFTFPIDSYRWRCTRKAYIAHLRDYERGDISPSASNDPPVHANNLQAPDHSPALES